MYYYITVKCNAFLKYSFMTDEMSLVNSYSFCIFSRPMGSNSPNSRAVEKLFYTISTVPRMK